MQIKIELPVGITEQQLTEIVTTCYPQLTISKHSADTYVIKCLTSDPSVFYDLGGTVCAYKYHIEKKI